VQPEEVLRLINSAPRRYDTVRAALRYRGDGAIMRTLRDRYRASEAYRLETGGSPDPSEGVGYPEPYGPFGWRCRVWYAKVSPERGSRYRLELELPKEVYPDGGWTYRPGTGGFRARAPRSMPAPAGARARTTPRGSGWRWTASGAPTFSTSTASRAFH
jgi:hypothetical protein